MFNSLYSTVLTIFTAATVALWAKALWCLIHAVYFKLDDDRLTFKKAWKIACRMYF